MTEALWPYSKSIDRVAESRQVWDGLLLSCYPQAHCERDCLAIIQATTTTYSPNSPATRDKYYYYHHACNCSKIEFLAITPPLSIHITDFISFGIPLVSFQISFTKAWLSKMLLLLWFSRLTCGEKKRKEKKHNLLFCLHLLACWTLP